ncbi:hypothetical protein ACF1G0_12195 [Streptomyces sp. NPDC013953]|uniref:hypothetical protein n=1 Tax=Streptomyces sp. NPDC013953 TaxID=3364868 RepID=UPI0036FC98B4
MLCGSVSGAASAFIAAAVERERHHAEGRAFALDVRLHKASAVGNAPDLLEVTVESACYRAK